MTRRQHSNETLFQQLQDISMLVEEVIVFQGGHCSIKFIHYGRIVDYLTREKVGIQ
jgi:hypothetical protein